MALPKEVVKDICDFTDNLYELKAQCRDRCAMLQEDTLDFKKMNAFFSQRDYEFRSEMYQLRRENARMYQLHSQLRLENKMLVMEKSQLDEENRSLKRKIDELSK